MNAQALVQECHSRGVTVKPLPDGKIYVDPIANVPGDLRNELVANKPQIHEYLTARNLQDQIKLLDKPRGLTPHEIELLSLYAHDLGLSKPERDYLFEIANESSQDRVQLLRLAEG